MPTMFCPGCGKSISAEEKAKGYCPGCGKPLSGDTETATPPPSPRPAPRPRLEVLRLEEETPGVSPSLLGWGTVRAGLAQTVLGSLLLAFSLLVIYVINITALDGHGTNVLIVVLGALCGVGVFAGFIAAVAGSFMGCAAPAESGAKGWAIVYSIFLTLVVVLGAVRLVAERETESALLHLGPRLDRAPSWQPDELRMVRNLLLGSLFLSQVCYLLFLRSVVSFFQRGALALGVVCYLAFNLLVSTGLILLLTGVLDLSSLPIQGEGLAYLFISLFVTLGVWGVVLVGQVRGAVTRGMLKS